MFGDSDKDTVQGPFEVFRHTHSSHKEVEWDLKVNAKWVFIGDSNLCILSHHDMKEVEIHSYPGARFRQITTILEKISPNITVETVLLAIGLNTRQQHIKETTIKNLKGTLEAATQAFPWAKIFILLINFSSHLPSLEKENLKGLNRFILFVLTAIIFSVLSHRCLVHVMTTYTGHPPQPDWYWVIGTNS